MAEIVMPRLSDTMEEGTILRWLVEDGETVRRGQEIVEIETDKATMTYESDLDGALAIVAAEGDTLPVGAVIARVGETAPREGTGPRESPEETPSAPAESESAPATAPGTPDGAGPEAESLREAEGSRVKASPLARRIAREAGVDLRPLTGSGPGGRIVKADVQAAAGRGPRAGSEPANTIAASPTDIEAPPTDTGAQPIHAGAQPTHTGARPRAGEPAGVTTAKGETTEIELSRTQQTIARRMAESKATIPHFALQADIDMQECVRLRAELKRLAPVKRRGSASPPGAGTSGEETPGEAIPTYNDMVVKACALALREHPRANSSYRDGRLQLHGRVNVGVAVAVEAQESAAGGAGSTGGAGGDMSGAGGGALIVPTVFDADLKSLGEIARETRALAARVREGSITPPELSGATFTVSNLGMFGIAAFTAIVNPPQAAILAVGSVAPRPVVRESGDNEGTGGGGTGGGGGSSGDSGGGGGGETGGDGGELVVRHTMTVTLACDHRILYGADAARFLARIRELLEQPAALTL